MVDFGQLCMVVDVVGDGDIGDDGGCYVVVVVLEYFWYIGQVYFFLCVVDVYLWQVGVQCFGVEGVYVGVDFVDCCFFGVGIFLFYDVVYVVVCIVDDFFVVGGVVDQGCYQCCGGVGFLVFGEEG